MILIDIKTLSEYLGVKRKTLYSWAAQGRILSLKIHRLLRFDREEIDSWLMSLKKETQGPSPSAEEKRSQRHQCLPANRDNSRDDACLNNLVSKAIQKTYNSRRRGTRPSSSPKREEKNGAV